VVVGDSLLFVFSPGVSLTDAEETLHLAMFAVEGLAGRARVRLDTGYRVNPAGHAIAVDGTTPVGRLVVKVFVGLLLREFGEAAFRVGRETAGSVDAGLDKSQFAAPARETYSGQPPPDRR
jgi:hypothetical protein